MGKFDALAEALGLAVKKYGDDAAKILKKVDSPELATSLKGEARGDYLKALDEVYGPTEKRAAEMGFGKRTWYHGTTVPVDEFKKEALGLSTNAQSAKKGFFFAEDPSTASDYAELAREKGVIREGDKVTTRFLSETADLHEEAYQKAKDLAFERDIALGNIHRQIERNSNTEYLIKRYLNSDPPKGITKKEHLERIDELKKKLDDGKLWIEKQRDIVNNNSHLIKQIDDQIGSQGQNVLPVRLKGSPENIHVKNYKGESYRDTTYAEEMAKAQAEGKTGVLFKNTYDPADPNNRVKQDIAAVFEPSQIRSEFAAFDPRFKKSPLLMAGALAAPMSQMDEKPSFNPLETLKEGAKVGLQGVRKASEAWEEFKRPYAEALGRQFNIAGATPEVEKPMQEIGNIALDPLNIIGGAPGAAIGLLQTASQFAPKSPEEEALSRIRAGRK